MTTSEYLELFMMSRKEQALKLNDEESAYEIAQLTSGSFVYALYDNLLQFDIEEDAVAEHLEHLYDTGNHFGLIYFIVMLADATGFALPKTFIEMSLNDDLVPILSAAIIEDWLDI